MKVIMTNDLSEALLKLPVEKIKSFINAIDGIKDLNKSEILALDKTIKLAEKNNTELYAYEISDPFYVLFAFLPKQTIILIDIMELIDGKDLKFLVFSEKLDKNSKVD